MIEHLLAGEPNYSRILNSIENCQDLRKLTAFYENARKKNVLVICEAALSQLKTLLPVNKKRSFESSFWEMIAAYQKTLLENGRPTLRLNKAWTSALTDGESEVLVKWIEEQAQPWAFQSLIDQGLSDMTAESLVLRFPKRFDAALRERAKRRLKGAHQETLGAL